MLTAGEELAVFVRPRQGQTSLWNVYLVNGPCCKESVWATAGEKMAGFVQQQLPQVLSQLLALEAGDDAEALRRGVSGPKMRAPDAASCKSVYSAKLGGLAQGAC